MTKYLTKIIAITMLFAILLTSTAMAVCARSSDYISSANASISGKSGEVTVSFTIRATGSMSTIGASKIEIKNSSGTTVKTFYSSTTTGMTTSSARSYTSSVTYTGTSGAKYYAVVYFTAKNSSGSDSTSFTTSTATA